MPPFRRIPRIFAKRWPQLPRRPRRRTLVRRLAWSAIAGLGALIGTVLFAFFAPLEPLEERAFAPGPVLLDANGVVIQRDLQDGLRIPVALDQIAPVMIEATIAAEDQRFWQHPGVDPLAMGRAVLSLPNSRSGASTITQQLARRLYLDGASLPLLLRKAREAAIAFQLEARYSKPDLLAAYLNAIYYGRGAYGIEAAARVYFGVSARNLDLAQASFLAGLPQLPSLYGDSENTSLALSRQHYVLDRLLATGRISLPQNEEATAIPLDFAPAEPDPFGQHFVQFVYQELADVRPDLLSAPGVIIETTLQAPLQREAERVTRLRLDEIKDKNAGNAAVVVLEPSSGRILTMVGSGDFFREPDGQINMALRPRQPGSALKPLLYVAAFERGYTAATPLLDIPTTFDTSTGPYAPSNYDRKFHGPVPLRTALASSLNVPAVRTLDDIGIDAFLNVAHRASLNTLRSTEAYGLALTLGVGEVRLLDLTAAYGAIGNGGRLVVPHAIERIRDRHGNVIYEVGPTSPTQVISPQHAFLITDILRDPDARVLGFGRQSPLETSVGAAVKTGTSDAARDNWTVGFTPDRVVGVWVGNADGAPTHGLSGSQGAAPLWRDVLSAAIADLPDRTFPPPQGVVQATVCAPTGLLPGPNCTSPVQEWFIAGTVPIDVESYYVGDPQRGVAINPPLEARAWSIEAGLAVAATDPTSAQPRVHIVHPASGSVLFLAPELAQQEALLRASVPAGTQTVEFRVDGALVGSAAGDDAASIWPLEVGTHTLEVTAVLADGTTAIGRSHYEVRE